MSQESGDLPQYAIRLSDDALDDIDEAQAHLEMFAGEEVAEQWLAGLRDALTTLSASPFRAIVPESHRFRLEMRHLIYRRSPGSVPYRILFYVVENDLDAPHVAVLAVRHGAQPPTTDTEARQIEARR